MSGRARRFSAANLMVVAGILLATSLYAQDGEPPEVHSKHFFYGCPSGTPATNDLIIRNIYALSSNDSTKFADWVAYRLDVETITGKSRKKRRWRKDPWLDGDETLEPKDYKGAHAALKTDRGHQAPMASFKGTADWEETNFLSNITPQKTALNQGPWKTVEEDVRGLVGNNNVVYVITGPLYERDMVSLPRADEPHTVPSGYWKIILVQTDKDLDSIKSASFVFEQETPRRDKPIDHLCAINDIESRSGLDFLRELPDDMEEQIESDSCRTWAVENFE